MSLNEAETCFELIDPILREKGDRMPYIKLETKAPVNPSARKGGGGLVPTAPTTSSALRGSAKRSQWVN